MSGWGHHLPYPDLCRRPTGKSTQSATYPKSPPNSQYLFSIYISVKRTIIA
ncbi:hypothetical protein D1BOALGB6SA_1816 [Olavius sp. associated proteobacterium Delta 1]|nr:hypothetical protein D1BOALGB6SA_1816 [Olavius sp. associated proteobacterium Delta 1]